MGLIRYVLRRLASLIPVVLGVTFITFVLSRVLVADPARAWAGPKAPPSVVAQLAASYHLNQPIPVQYFYYMRDILLGNWGTNPIDGRSVLSEISGYFPATLELALAAFLITIIFGIPLGVLAALRQDKKTDHGIRFLYLAGFSSPPFFIALLLLEVVAYYFGWLPAGGELSALGVTPPPNITGMIVVDSLLTGNWAAFWDSLQHLILPATTLALLTFGLVIRVTRASMLEVSQKEFVKASYAKGLTKRQVVTNHILRNALISTTTILGLILGAFLGGAIVIESIFQWPGIGLYAVNAIDSFDYPAVMGVTFVFTLGVVLANLLADIIYAYLNPRISL